MLTVIFSSSSTLIPLLGQNHSIEHVYFQEPRFNALDSEFLESRGYTIIHTPEFEDLITPETFLFAPSANLHIVLAAFQVTFPALFQGVPLTVHSDFSSAPGHEDT